MSNIEKVKFWCHKVIPLIYDDSLSYYEVVCKVAYAINEVIGNLEKDETAIETLITEVAKKFDTANIVQTTGENVDKVMSQKAVTDALHNFSTGVTSVNGKVGEVVLNKEDIGLGNVPNIVPYSESNTPPYPVTKVNGQTGEVVLNKEDIGLGNVPNVVPYSASNTPPYPVTSVNGQTGDVIVSGSGGDSNIFIAEANTTTYSAIQTAITNGMSVIAKVPYTDSQSINKFAYFNLISNEGTGGNNAFIFAGFVGIGVCTFMKASVTSDGWNITQSFELAKEMNFNNVTLSITYDDNTTENYNLYYRP